MIGLTRILHLFPKNKYLVQQKRSRSISKFSACVCLLTKKRFNDRPWFTHYRNKVLLHTRGQYLPRYTCTAAAVRFSVAKNTNKIGISAITTLICGD